MENRHKYIAIADMKGGLIRPQINGMVWIRDVPGGHWNPTNQPYGNHAGDFPVLFSNDGKAIMYFFTNKFKVRDIIGKSIIIHEDPDDYRSQPAGDSGRRLACGVFRPYVENPGF